jgi:hypothetical protein
MPEMMERLDEAFEYAAIEYLEKADHTGEELTDEEGRNVDLLYALQKSVKAISPELIQEASELEAKYPVMFEESLVTLLRSVSDQFRPATAVEFVEKLNNHIRRRTAALAVG